MAIDGQVVSLVFTGGLLDPDAKLVTYEKGQN